MPSLDSAITQLRPVLERLGFGRESPRLFCLRTKGVVQVIEFSASRQQEGRFAVSLGVFHQEAHRLQDLPPPPGACPRVWENCTFRADLGHLIPPHNSIWWSLKDTSAIQGIAPAIEEKAVPWLSRASDPIQMAQSAIQQGDPVLGIALLLEADRRSDAEVALKRVLEGDLHPEKRSYLLEWASNLGLGSGGSTRTAKAAKGKPATKKKPTAKKKPATKKKPTAKKKPAAKKPAPKKR